jgi:hypothetical protein
VFGRGQAPSLQGVDGEPCAAKLDSWRETFLLSQWGQVALAEWEGSRASKAFPQASQLYSKMGMRYSDVLS